MVIFEYNTTNMRPIIDETATIKFLPAEGREMTATVTMPIWKKEDKDGNEYVHLALFGDILFPLEKGQNEDALITDVLCAFFDACEDVGAGVHKELAALGWRPKNKNRNSLRMKPKGTHRLDTAIPNFSGMSDVGESKSVSLQVETC